MPYHTHYDEVRDDRWVCRRDPCLWHDVVPKPDDAAEMSTGGSPADVIRVLAQVLDTTLAERDRYRTALASIAANTCCDRCHEAALVAQATLLE